MAHSKLHLICGNCGSTEFSFRIDPKGRDISEDEEKYLPDVWIFCKNCSTLHALSEYAEYEE